MFRTGSMDVRFTPRGSSNAACGPLPLSTDRTHDPNRPSRLEVMVHVSPSRDPKPQWKIGQHLVWVILVRCGKSQ